MINTILGRDFNSAQTALGVSVGETTVNRIKTVGAVILNGRCDWVEMRWPPGRVAADSNCIVISSRRA